MTADGEAPLRGPSAGAGEAARRLFEGGGAMGALMSTIDWSATFLGAVESWPQSLRSAIGICLGSRFPIAIYWGPELALLYNDAWSPIPGSKHPWALGRPARDVWPEIWDAIGPLFHQVMSKGEATYSEDGLLLMHRHGYTEECYFNFTFTPVRGEGERVEGVFNAVIETTFRVISERRTRVLHELSERTAPARSSEEGCRLAAACLGEAAHDVPFCALYLLNDSDGVARLAGQAGLPPDSPMLPATVPLNAGTSPWPFAAVKATGAVEAVRGLNERLSATLPGGAWPEPADTAMVAPLLSGGQVSGFLILGASPRRAIDEEYRQFAARAAAVVAAVVSNAQAYEAERKRAEALAEVDRVKTAFFSNVSHEFRTPLTLMLGPLEEALLSPEGVLAGESLKAVHRNTRRLLKLVNSLLDFSRIEAGRMEASYRPTDLAELTRDLASSFRSAVEEAGLRLEVDCPPLAELVQVDPDMWEKIVLNLLSNAFKFTFAGTIAVRLRSVGAAVELQVSDTGTGIAEVELPRLFERFHRIEGVPARTHEGSGIGLALVDDLVRLHGGTIAVGSRLGEGTVFTVSLPLATQQPAGQVERAASPRGSLGAAAYVDEARRWSITPTTKSSALVASPTNAQSAPTTISSARVLVADDNADMLDYITRLLDPRWTVEVASDGVQALAAARARPPDLVLTDVMMPRLDGFGLLAALRADAGTAAIPVIMLSARAGDESRVEGLTAGADDYLVKPFSARELLARAVTHIQLARLRRTADDANRAKDEFLAMLGHELRNPLSPIVTALQLLRMRGIETREHAIISRQVNHLIRLVDDLLDISRITRGTLELRKQPVELAQVVLRGLEVASPLLEQRQHTVDCEVPAEGLLVDGDPDRLAQVVANLLTNAAKYSDGARRVRITAERAGKLARLRVRDQGVGIPAEMLERIFDMFIQQAQSIERSRGGLGLGLAIVRSLVELHGGTVHVTSDGPGKGSEFVVELPLVLGGDDFLDAAAERPRLPAGTAPPTGANSHRVLVVDDNVDAAETIAEVLADLGYQVQLAHDGPSALERAATFRPNVCLLDIGLPVMDGYELARRLRATNELPEDMRIIAITGYGQNADRRRSTDAGFDAHLVKPVDFEVLIRTLAAS